MAIDPFGGTLSSIALFFPIYDACNRIHDGWKVMGTFGKDMDVFNIRLESQWLRLYHIMNRYRGNLVNPPDPDDEQHWVTRVVKSELSVIRRLFEECDTLVSKYKGNRDDILASGALLPAAATTGESGSMDLNAGASGALRALQDPPPAKSKKRWYKRVKNFKRPRTKLSTSTPSATNTSAPTSRAITATTSGTTIPELQQSDIEQGMRERDENSQLLQEESHVLRRVVWAHHDRDKLKDTIAELKRSISALDQTLPYKSADAPASLLTVNPKASPKKWKNIQVQNALERLHESLRRLNSTSAGGEPWSFSIYIATPFDENWDLVFSQEEYLPLRKDSFLFSIQRQRATDVGNQSDLLLIETLKEPPSPSLPSSNITVESMTNLDGPAKLESPGMQNPYEVWGSISAAGNPGDHHYIFHDVERWTRKETLADLLDRQEWRDGLGIGQALELVKYILVAHLDFARVRSTCANPRPVNLVYYEITEGNIPEEGPHFLRPYLSIGFGTSPPRRRPGATRGSIKHADTAMVELGLVLFQVGSRERLSYEEGVGGQDALSATKNNALAKLSQVERFGGPMLAEIVQICLEYQASGLSDGGREEALVEKILDALVELQNALKRSVI